MAQDVRAVVELSQEQYAALLSAFAELTRQLELLGVRLMGAGGK